MTAILGWRFAPPKPLIPAAYARAYKTGNISETVDDKAKVTINGLYSHTLAFDCRQNA